MFRIDFTMTEDDYVAFNLHAARTSPTIRRSNRWAVVAVSLGAGAATEFVLSGMFNRAVSVSAAVAVVILTAWLLPHLYRRTVRTQIHKMVRREGSGMVGPGRLVVDDHGLHETVGHTSTSVPWTGVGQVTETPEHVFIHVTAMSGFVVPKRGNEHAARQLLNLLERRITTA